MDKYEKKARCIMERGNAIIAERKRRKAIIRRSAAIGFGAAAVLGIGICANALKPPAKPTGDSSGIVTATAPAATSTTAVSSTEAVRTSVSTSARTTASTSGTSITATQTVTTVTAANTSSNVTASAATSSAPAETACATSAAVTASDEVTVTAQTSVPTSAASSSSAETTVTTVTTARTYPTLELVPSQFKSDSSILIGFEELELFDGNTYSKEFYCISEKNVGTLLDELNIRKSPVPYSMPLSANAKIYEIKDISPEYQLAVRFDGSNQYHVYVNPFYGK